MNEGNPNIDASKKLIEKFYSIVNSFKNKNSTKYSSLRKHAIDFAIIASIVLVGQPIIQKAHEFQENRLFEETFHEKLLSEKMKILPSGFAVLIEDGSVLLSEDKEMVNIPQGKILELFQNIAEKAHERHLILTYHDNQSDVVMKVDENKKILLDATFENHTKSLPDLEISVHNLESLKRLTATQQKIDHIDIVGDKIYEDALEQSMKTPE